jgi:hypothetical protein
MRGRKRRERHLGFEFLEQKRLLSANASAEHVLNQKAGTAASALHTNSSPTTLTGQTDHSVELGQPTRPRTGPRLPKIPTAFLGHRITNPTGHPVNLKPAAVQVLVQSIQPVPGQVYNVHYVAVKNATAQTFTAKNGFLVRLPGGQDVSGPDRR